MYKWRGQVNVQIVLKNETFLAVMSVKLKLVTILTEFTLYYSVSRQKQVL